MDAAERRGIPVRRLNQRSLVQLGHGKHRKLVQATLSDGTGAIAVDIAGDKQMTKSLLEQAWLPVPRGRVVANREQALEALAELKPPVVVKPLDGHQGKGVSIELTTPEEVLAAFEIAREFSSHVMIEEYLTGEDYRVLVIGGRMVAAARRVPPQVIGDGLHTVQQLVDRENENPLRGDGHEKPLTCIRIDQIVLAWLERQGMAVSSVPAPGQVVSLRQGANLSTGGSAIDVTDELHPAIVRTCERAATVIGLDICGLDLVLPDIHSPVESGSGGIVEANAAPGLRMHLYPAEGKPRPVGDAIVEMLYPAGASGRIPIISVTGTNGKTTTARLIEFILASTGLLAGMTTTDGIYIAGQEIVRGDMTGPRSARTVLADPSVEVAVLETAQAGSCDPGWGTTGPTSPSSPTSSWTTWARTASRASMT